MGSSEKKHYVSGEVEMRGGESDEEKKIEPI